MPSVADQHCAGPGERGAAHAAAGAAPGCGRQLLRSGSARCVRHLHIRQRRLPGPLAAPHGHRISHLETPDTAFKASED